MSLIHSLRQKALFELGRALTLAAAIACVGCGQSVHIPIAPFPTGDVAIRREYYRRYRARNVEEAVVTGYVNGRFTASVVFAGIRLANGDLVVDPEDLRPAIGNNSYSSQALDRRAHIESARTTVVVGGIVATIGGLLLAFLGPNRNAAGMSDPTVPIIGTTIAGLGLSTVLIQQPFFNRLSGAERERALIMFNESMREAVGLCGDGTRLGDCANVEPNVARAIAGIPHDRLEPDPRQPTAFPRPAGAVAAPWQGNAPSSSETTDGGLSPATDDAAIGADAETNDTHSQRD